MAGTGEAAGAGGCTTSAATTSETKTGRARRSHRIGNTLQPESWIATASVLICLGVLRSAEPCPPSRELSHRMRPPNIVRRDQIDDSAADIRRDVWTSQIGPGPVPPATGSAFTG